MALFEPVGKPIISSLNYDSGPNLLSTVSGMSFSFAALCNENGIIGAEG